MEPNTTYNIDALVFLKSLPDKSCDIFTDVPYNVGKNYGKNVNDKKPEDEYKDWLRDILNEIVRVGVVITLYVPKKYNLFMWNIIGDTFQEIILPFKPAGAIRYGFSNQYNKLLTNSRPKNNGGGYVLNVWDNMQQPGLGFFFRENTYGHAGYTSQAITERVVKELCSHDLIVDPFMGTGTTAISALKFGKQFMGSELNQNFIAIQEKRIALFKMQPELF